MTKITVIGAGSWGTALAMVLADNGHDVRIWGNRSELMDEINTKHENSRYLPGITLPSTIVAYSASSTDESVPRCITRDERNCYRTSYLDSCK